MCAEREVSTVSLNELTDILLKNYLAINTKNRPFIVAIDGLSGAGKTTLTKEIKRELNNQNVEVSIFHIDDHIVESSERYKTGYEEWYEYYYLQWDIELLKKRLFEKLHNDFNNIRLPFYNNSADRNVMKQISVESDCIVLIEGIFLQRKEWKEFFDLTIFIECPSELRYDRALNRDLYIGDYQERLAKYKRRYWPGEDHYLTTENPVVNADIVFNPNNFNGGAGEERGG